MTKRVKTTYSPEFRESSAKLAHESTQPISKTAEELDIHPTTLYSWVDKYYGNNNNKTTTEPANTQEELIQLRKENAKLKQERDILKKAAAYFANETK